MRRGLAVLGVAVLMVVGLARPGHASSRHVSSSDAAASEAFLQATRSWYEAQVAAAPASVSSLQTQAAALEKGCAGVLDAQPPESGRPPSGAPARRGRALLRSEQESAISWELESALESAQQAPVASALATYRTALEGLRWSNPALTARVREQASVAGAFTAVAPVDACSDVRAWEASGFTRLAPASRAYAAARFSWLLTLLLLYAFEPSRVSLTQYETPGERRLSRADGQLSAEATVALRQTNQITARVEQVLGATHAQEQQGGAPPPSESVLVGTGVPAAGGVFVVSVSRSAAGSGPACSPQVEVEYVPPAQPLSGALSGSSSSSIGTCEAGGGPGQARAFLQQGCTEGTRTFQERAPAGATRGRLLLADGRSITSAVVAIPAALGGGGEYFQATTGSPPVKLTFLGPGARRLRSERITGGQLCRAARIPAAAVNRLAPIASGVAPGAIRYRLLFTEVGSGHPQIDPLTEGSAVGGEPEALPASHGPLHAIAWAVCSPVASTIIVGRLSAAGGSVLARSASGLQRLATAPLRASLGGGRVAFASFASPPTELIVRRAGGSTVQRIALRTLADAENEFCAARLEPGQ